ncbi:MAG: DUF2125 domain-containing protein [Rhodospirillales bacterium]|nr:DUF2125 domain-containing protein [Rhodospirillales bacterium]
MVEYTDKERQRKIRSAFQARQVMNYKPPAYFAVIRRTMISLVAIATFSIAYVAMWFYTAQGLRSNLEDWAVNARQAGWAVTYKQPVLSGFPFAIRLTLNTPSFATSGDDPDWSWKGPELVIQSRPWNPGRYLLKFPEHNELTLKTKAGPVSYGGLSQELTVEFKPGEHGPKYLLIHAKNVALQAITGAKVGARSATIEATHDPSNPEDIKSPSLSFKINAQDLVLPAHFKLPMGAKVSKLSINGAVMGGIEPGLLRSSLATWRDAGGTMEIPKFSMRYGPFHLIRSDGTVALDGNLQPVGAFTAKVIGFHEFIDALRVSGWVRGKDSLTVKLVTSAFFQKDENGGPPTLNLAVSIQNGKIFTGQAKLVDMPHVNWGPKVASD